MVGPLGPRNRALDGNVCLTHCLCQRHTGCCECCTVTVRRSQRSSTSGFGRSVLCAASVSRRPTLSSTACRQHESADGRSKFNSSVLTGLPPSSDTVLHICRPQWKSTVTEFVDELSDIIASLSVNYITVCSDVNCPDPTMTGSLTCSIYWD